MPPPSVTSSPASLKIFASMPGKGTVAEPGLVVVRPGQRRDHDRAGLGLPPRVDDRAAAAADVLVVPEPGARVDRLADRAEQPQRAEVVLFDVLEAPLHAGADRGRRRVHDRHAVALDDLPPAVLGRVVGRALVHHRGRAVGERPVDDVAVAGDPADVGRAPVDVVVLEVEDELVGGRDAGQIAAGRVLDALRLGRRARGVEDEQRILGVHRLRRALGVGVGEQVVPEAVAALGHRRVGVAAVDDDHVLERVEILDRGVERLLHRRRLAAPQRRVGGDQRLGARDLHPLDDRAGGEAAEDDVVDRADPRAGEHRHGRLGHHRHEDADDVALADAERLQPVREALDLVEQPRVGDLLAGPVLALPVVGDALAVARRDVAVEAVGGDVQLAAREPLGERRIRPVEDLVERLDPVELLGPRAPPRLGVVVRPLVDARVGGVRLRDELGRRREGLLGREQHVQIAALFLVALLGHLSLSSRVPANGSTAR